MGWVVNLAVTWFARQALALKIIIVVVLGLLPVLAVALFFYANNLRKSIEDEWGAWLQGYAYHLASRTNANLGERQFDVLLMSGSAVLNQNLETRLEHLIANSREKYSQMLVLDKNGKILAAAAQDESGESLETRSLLGRDLSSESWFQSAKKLPEGEFHQLEPEVDQLQKQLEPGEHLGMRFSAPIRNAAGQVIGVWSNLYKWSDIENLVFALQERGENENSSINFVILNRLGVVLEHPEKTLIKKSTITDSAAQVQKDKSEGFVVGRNYKDQTPEKGMEGWFRSTFESDKLGWVFVASESYQDIEDSVRQSIIEVLWICLAVLVVVVVVLVLATRYVSRGLKQLGQNAADLALGDLEQNLGRYPKDELGRFAESFRTMIGYQQRMANAASAIRQGDLSQQVTPASDKDVLGQAFNGMTKNLTDLLETLQKGTVALSSASEQMRASSQAQASSVSGQFAAIAQTSATVDEVQTTTEQALEYAVQTRESAKSIRQVVQLGVEATDQANQSMGDIKARVSDIAENILALSEQTQAIGDIIALVGKLSDQSNLLSLNAAIEAARAGEHGKGFGVVALEIRTLAEQSKAATVRVRDLLSQIQSATNSAVMTTEQGIKVAESGVESIARVSEVISHLSEAIESAAQNAHLISASVQQHSVGMNQIADAMQHLKTNAETTLSASEQSKSSANALAELARRLKNLTDGYTLPQNSHSKVSD
jgi:methyl-accepting chemotaxis protein